MITSVNFPIGEPIRFAINSFKELSESETEFVVNIDENLSEQEYIVKTEFAGDKTPGKVCDFEGDRAAENAAPKTCFISAGDEAGAMYALIDIGRKIRNGIALSSCRVKPFLKKRGIKFNIPLDSRTPSYTDSGDSAIRNIENMWDRDFWTEFLDTMALNHYNTLTLWTLSLFPSLVLIPEYPECALSDVKRAVQPFRGDANGPRVYHPAMDESLITVKKMTIQEKIEFFRFVMQYAKDRCIDIYFFTWNLFTFGTEHTSYGITCDQNNPVTRDYFMKGTKALLDTYPLLKGIGITAGEFMNRDETDELFIHDTYGLGIKAHMKEHPERDFTLIHRMHNISYDRIASLFSDIPCRFEVSFKYSQAHMYSDTKPHFMDAFLKEKKKELKVWLTLRNDDFYHIRWGDPEYAKEFLENMPADELLGFFMGPDGIVWGRDYTSKTEPDNPLYFKRMWFMLLIWGQLSYDMKTPYSFFEKVLGGYYNIDGKILLNGWKNASRVIPKFQCIHFHDFDYQWNPETCCYMETMVAQRVMFADINEFVYCPAITNGNYYSVQEYVSRLVAGSAMEKVTPESVASEIEGCVKTALDSLKNLTSEIEKRQIDEVAGAVPRMLTKVIGPWESIKMTTESAGSGDSFFIERLKELKPVMEDIRLLCLLGEYLVNKERAAISLALYRKTGKKDYQKEAVRLSECSGNCWKEYSRAFDALYKPQALARMREYVDITRFDLYAEDDKYLAAEEWTDSECPVKYDLSWLHVKADYDLRMEFHRIRKEMEYHLLKFGVSGDGSN